MLYDHRTERTWRHVDCYEFKCFARCRAAGIQSSAGVKTIRTPWATAPCRFTSAFERWAIHLLKATKNQTKTAQLLRCKFDTVNRIQHRSVSRGMERRSLEEIAHASVDEKALQHGHRYATMVSDSKRGVVIDVGKGRDKASAKPLLGRLLAQKRGTVQTITTDMWKAYITPLSRSRTRSTPSISSHPTARQSIGSSRSLSWSLRSSQPMHGPKMCSPGRHFKLCSTREVAL